MKFKREREKTGRVGRQETNQHIPIRHPRLAPTQGVKWSSWKIKETYGEEEREALVKVLIIDVLIETTELSTLKYRRRTLGGYYLGLEEKVVRTEKE